MRLVWLTLAIAACGEDLPAPGDLTAPTVENDLFGPPSTREDLSVVVRDLAITNPAFTPYDPGSPANFCGGPDGGLSCAQSFFFRLAFCYRPAGVCDFRNSGNSQRGACWESGAQQLIVQQVGMPGKPPYQVYAQGASYCATIHRPDNTTIANWTLWDGSTLTVDESSGDIACDDGTHGNFNDCPALTQLLTFCSGFTVPFVDACPILKPFPSPWP